MFKKLASLILTIALSFALGSAAIARSSHEAHAPQKVFVSGKANVPIIQLCSAKQLLDDKGAPVKIVHINACGKCVIGGVISSACVEPINIVLQLLLPPTKSSVYYAPLTIGVKVPPAAPRASQAPPVFS